MKILYLCKTPYQVLAATRIVLTKHNNDESSIVLFDTIANVDLLTKGIIDSNVYSSVSILESKKYLHNNQLLNHLRSLIVKVIYDTDEIYDVIYFSNVHDWVENQIVRSARKQAVRRGKKLMIFMFEDGFSTYSSHYGNFFHQLNNCNILKRLIYYRIYEEYYKIQGLFVFSPELMEWKPKCKVFEIPKIQEEDKTFIKKINCMFGFAAMNDTYDEDIIFFEESYYADGKNVNDMDIVNRLIDVLGKGNLFVKIHPRNPVNRFSTMGVKTNVNTEIPWEVVALNIDLKEKILVTIASGSALTSLVNMKCLPRKIIMLMDCNEIDETLLTPSLQTIRKIAKFYNEYVSLPNSISEFEEILEE